MTTGWISAWGEGCLPTGISFFRLRRLELGRRSLGAGLLGWAAATAVLHFLPADDFAAFAAIKLLLAAGCLLLAPGLLTVALVGPARRWELPALAASSLGISLGLIQLPTMASMILGLPLPLVMACWLAAGAASAGWLLARGGAGLRLAWSPAAALVFTLLALAGGLLYVKGSPIAADEDQVHIAVVRRLAVVAHPAPDTIYYAPGVVYTHPFPGTHYLLSSAGWLAGVDPIFTYQKMRFAWTAAALLFVFQLARLIFQRTDVALASLGCAAALLLNGSFADFQNIFWGQLAPYSHPSDVAMSVLLPALLVAALSFYQARARAEGVFHFACSALLVFMLTLSHVREVLQFLVYNGAFLVATLLYRGRRAYALRALALIALVVGVVTAYGLYHQQSVEHVTEYNRQFKGQVVQTLRETRARDLVFGPPVAQCWSISVFYRWHPWVVLLSPLLLLAYSRRPMVLLTCGSIFAYLLLMRVPILTHLWALATYWEVLMTPVRNYAFFVYILTGPLLLLLARLAARLPAVPGLAVTTLLGAGLGLAACLPEGSWSARPDCFYVTGLGLYAFAVAVTLVPGWAAALRSALVLRPAGGRPAAALLLLLVVAASAASVSRAHSPLAVQRISTSGSHFRNRAPVVLTPGEWSTALRPVTVRRWRCTVGEPGKPALDFELKDLQAQLPPASLIRWMHRALSAEDVLAVSNYNAVPAPLFTPQRVNAWPLVAGNNFCYYQKLFPAFYEHLLRAHAAHGGQPFFDSREAPADRLRFLLDQNVTHVLVDPASAPGVMPALREDPDCFRTLREDGGWIVLEFIPPAGRPSASPAGIRLSKETTQ